VNSAICSSVTGLMIEMTSPVPGRFRMSSKTVCNVIGGSPYIVIGAWPDGPRMLSTCLALIASQRQAPEVSGRLSPTHHCVFAANEGDRWSAGVCVIKISTCDTPATSVTTATLSVKIIIEQSHVELDLRVARTDLEGGRWAKVGVGDSAGQF
jgi:hypothetical protein